MKSVHTLTHLASLTLYLPGTQARVVEWRATLVLLFSCSQLYENPHSALVPSGVSERAQHMLGASAKQTRDGGQNPGVGKRKRKEMAACRAPRK